MPRSSILWRPILGLVALLTCLSGCTDAIDAKGEKGAAYALLFEPGPAADSLLSVADGLTGPAPEAVLVVRSLDDLLGAAVVKRLKAHPLVQANRAKLKAEFGIDPVAAMATDAPVAMVANAGGAVFRLTLNPDGLMAFQSALNIALASGKPIKLLGFEGKVVGERDEFCALVKGKEVIVGAGEGPICSTLVQHAGLGAAWRADLERENPPAPPLAVMYHGDTRSGGEPTGVPFLDALEEMPGLDHERGVFELSAPENELAVRYRARPVEAAKLTAEVEAAIDRLPPLGAVPASDPLVFQFLLPHALREGFDGKLLNQLIEAALFPADWPKDEVMPILASFGAYGGTMALGAGTAARKQTTLGRLGGSSADFKDAKAWQIGKTQCGVGPRNQVYCASNRKRLSAALARAGKTTVPKGQALFMRFDLSSFQAEPARYGFPPEAIGFVKAVRKGVMRARLIDGWLEMDVQLKGTSTPVRAQAVALLEGLLGG